MSESDGLAPVGTVKIVEGWERVFVSVRAGDCVPLSSAQDSTSKNSKLYRLYKMVDPHTRTARAGQSRAAKRTSKKKTAWSDREAIWMQPLRDAGFHAEILNFASRHCRVQLGNMRFDFWPSTGVWLALWLTKNDRWKISYRGKGAESMVEAMKSKTPAKIT